MTVLPKVKLVGQRASWFVDTPWGRLPVVHKHHWDTGGVHFHPAGHATTNAAAASRNHDYLLALRATTLVVVSDDEVTEHDNAPPDFRRKGYVGVFQIADFKEEPNGDWSFRYVRREANAA